MAGSLVVRGGRVLVEGRWEATDLRVVDGVVAASDGSGVPGGPVLDVPGCLVAPGLVDLQCNGAVGIDLTGRPEQLWDLARALPRWGVTAWLPTIVTSPPAVVDRALTALAGGPPEGFVGAVPLGLHLEGPFLSPDAAGAHPVDLLRSPTSAAVAGWTRAGGVAMVTLAPELDGALEVISALAGAGVVVAIGHSRATEAEVRAAVSAGARAVTHLFNAMSPLHHRAPGMVGAALADRALAVGLIVDGLHVEPTVVGIAHRALGDRLHLVSDAVALLGTSEADPAAGVRLPDGTLAGSVLPLVDAVANLVAFAGAPVEDALDAASRRPAALLADPSRGRLVPGARGDLVVLGPDLDLRYTVVDGVVVHESAP